MSEINGDGWRLLLRGTQFGGRSIVKRTRDTDATQAHNFAPTPTHNVPGTPTPQELTMRPRGVGETPQGVLAKHHLESLVLKTSIAPHGVFHMHLIFSSVNTKF